jgi:hypothetical protein
MTLHDLKIGIISAIVFLAVCSIPWPCFASEVDFEDEKSKIESILTAAPSGWEGIHRTGQATCGRVKIRGEWHDFVLGARIGNDWAIAAVYQPSRYQPKTLTKLCK